MHKESFYQFILYTLLKEGKSNIPFRLEAFLTGKRCASKHWFLILFRGCDIPSFLHMKELFEQENPQYIIEVKDSDIERDMNGFMTGKLSGEK